MRINTVRKITLLIISVTLAFLLTEIVARLRSDSPFHFHNFLKKRLDFSLAAYPAQYHPRLGWTPQPGDHSNLNIWNTEVVIEADGFRSSGTAIFNSPYPSQMFLAVGDSFTFGDQVSDRETWPAYLQSKTKIKVVNAGVFAYGLDQIVLRAESLLDTLKPTWVILSFIPNDIRRCELSARSGVHKPYFTLTNGLTLHNVPVPRPEPLVRRVGVIRTLLGYSIIADQIMMRHAKEYWLLGFSPHTRMHDQGREVACALFSRLDASLKAKGIRGLVVIQAEEKPTKNELEQLDIIREHLKQTSLNVLDLQKELENLKRHHPRQHKSFFSSHMTPKGNKWVAEQIASFFFEDDSR